VFAVSDRDLQRLDNYEGVPGGAYTREEIVVYDNREKPVPVLTYIATPQKPGKFAPHKDYIDLYIRGATYFGLPAEYVESLKAIETPRASRRPSKS